MNTYDKLKKLYENGGKLNAAIDAGSNAQSNTSGAFNMVGDLASAIPGIGAIAGPAISAIGAIAGLASKEKAIGNSLNAQYGDIKENTTPFKLGGDLEKGSTEDFKKFAGLSHEMGGMDINTDGVPMQDGNHEVEGDESAVTFTNLNGETLNFVFSKSLKI